MKNRTRFLMRNMLHILCLALFVFSTVILHASTENIIVTNSSNENIILTLAPDKDVSPILKLSITPKTTILLKDISSEDSVSKEMNIVWRGKTYLSTLDKETICISIPDLPYYDENINIGETIDRENISSELPVSISNNMILSLNISQKEDIQVNDITNTLLAQFISFFDKNANRQAAYVFGIYSKGRSDLFVIFDVKSDGVFLARGKEVVEIETYTLKDNKNYRISYCNGNNIKMLNLSENIYNGYYSRFIFSEKISMDEVLYFALVSRADVEYNTLLRRQKNKQ